MSVLSIFKNNFSRIIRKKSIILLALIITPIMVAAAVCFTSKTETKVHIAMCSNNESYNTNNKYMEIKVLNEKPKNWELLLGKYDAIVTERTNGKFSITTLKSMETKNNIEKYFDNHSTKASTLVRLIHTNGGRTGTNILGFLTVIILFLGVSLMTLYPEDRDFGTFRRILISPMSSRKYLFAQGLFVCTVVFVPAYISVLFCKFVFDVDIVFNIGTFTALLVLLCVLATAFSLFMTTVIDNSDNCILLSSFLIIVLGVLSGCFSSVEYTNKIINLFTNVIPIKSYMVLVQGLENGNSIFNYIFRLAYILICIILLWGVGSLITNKKLKVGRY